MKKYILVTIVILSLSCVNLFAEKVVVGFADFQTSNPNPVYTYKTTGVAAFGLASTEGYSGFVKRLELPSGQSIKKVKAYIKHNSSKRISIALGYSDVTSGVITIIASKNLITSFGSDDVKEIVLDINMPDHVVNNKKYEYALGISFDDGGDDGNLMFYGAKIKLK